MVSLIVVPIFNIVPVRRNQICLLTGPIGCLTPSHLLLPMPTASIRAHLSLPIFHCQAFPTPLPAFESLLQLRWWWLTPCYSKLWTNGLCFLVWSDCLFSQHTWLSPACDWTNGHYGIATFSFSILRPHFPWGLYLHAALEISIPSLCQVVL